MNNGPSRSPSRARLRTYVNRPPDPEKDRRVSGRGDRDLVPRDAGQPAPTLANERHLGAVSPRDPKKRSLHKIVTQYFVHDGARSPSRDVGMEPP